MIRAVVAAWRCRGRDRRAVAVPVFVLATAAALAAAAPRAGAQQGSARDSVRRDSAGLPAAPDSAPPPMPSTVGPLFIPALFYGPETGVGGGGGVLYLRNVDPKSVTQRPSSHAVNMIVTAKGQYVVSLLNDVWTRGNRWKLSLDLSSSRYPNRVYGIGSVSVDTGETFTPSTSSVLLAAQRLMGAGVYTGAKFVYEDATIRDIAPGGILASGAVGAGGWRTAVLSWLTSWDRRDQIYWPTQGHLLSAIVGRSLGSLGSTNTFNRLTIDARGYRRLYGNHLFAAQLFAEFTDGAVPFDRLPQLGGGQQLRGFFAGRFRDRSSAVVQAEYRSPGLDWSWERRLAFVVFVASGGTARDPSGFAVDQLHTAGGAGLRFALTPGDRLNIRLDYGVGRGSSGFYITLGEAF